MEKLVIPTSVKDIDKIIRTIHNDTIRGMIIYESIKEKSGISNDEETRMYLKELIDSGCIQKNQNSSYSILFPGVVEKQRSEIEDLQKRLNEAQLKDIPKNAEDRTTVITWQIIAGVTVAFLLKHFGVNGWL